MTRSVLRWLMCLSCGCVLSGAMGDVVYLVQTDVGDETSFASALHWSDGRAPSAANDYLIDGAHQIRTPNNGATATFAGNSLQLGATNFSSQGDITLRTKRSDTDNSVGRIYIPNLQLYKGQIAVGCPKYTCWLGGTATVHSPASSPFYYEANISDARVIETAQNFVGEEGTGLRMKGKMTLGGTNDRYLGRWVLQDETFSIYNVKGLGGELSTVDTESIRLENAHLNFTQNVLVPATRGIYIANATAGATFTIGLTSTILSPISGGPLTVKGSSTLRYGGAFSSPALTVNGKVSLTNGFSMAETSTFTLGADGTLETAVPELRPTVWNFTGNGGKLLVNANATTGSCVDFRGSFTLKAPLAICLNSIVAIPRLAVATIPVASRVVTADDFTVSSEWYGLGIEGIEVTTDKESGLQTVWVLTTPFVTAVAGNPALFNTASHWSDNQTAHAGADYFAQGCHVREGGENSVYVFPGNSLTLFNPYGTANFSYVIKQGTFTCYDFRAYEHSGIGFGGPYSPQTFAGHLTVRTKDKVAFVFNGAAYRTNLVTATISGSGTIKITEPANYFLQADNSDYLGGIQVDGGNLSQFDIATLFVTNECCLGGNPTDFMPEALSLQARGVLRCQKSLTLDDVNRGLSFADGGKIFTEQDAVLTTRLQTTWKSAGAKDGPGVWELGGAVRSAASNARLIVRDGVLRPLAARVLLGVQLDFDTKAHYEIDHAAGDERDVYGLVVNKALAVYGESLPVKVRFSDAVPSACVQPLFTVPIATADALAAKLAVEKPSNTRVTVVTSACTFNDTAMTTISAKIEKLGFTLIVR